MSEREAVCSARESETARGAAELLAIAAASEGERAAMQAERDALERERTAHELAVAAQQRHLHEQADELRAVLELHAEKSARLTQWQEQVRVREQRLKDAELELQRRTECVNRVLDPFSAGGSFDDE